MSKRIDLEKFQEWWKDANDPDMGELDDIIHGYPIMLRELKRMYKIEDELRYQADWDLSCEEMGHKVRCHTCQKEFKAGDKYITAYVDSHCTTIPDGRLFFCNEKCEKASE